MIKDDKKITRVLFLLRSYNDIDHIVPIIWKCRQCKVDCYYLLVESDHSRDYRIGFIRKSGAIRIHSKVMNYYHSYARHFLISDNVKNIVDRLAGYMIGRPLLRKNKIEVVVTEWSGRSGRGKAKYILRPAFQLGLQVYSVPHGYNIYTNLDVSRTITNYRQRLGKWPDFSSRNAFTRYVVQHQSTKTFCESYGIQATKLAVLGSTRFCREWIDINEQISRPRLEDRLGVNLFKVVFFLPQWDYNVDRAECYRLIVQIGNIPEIFMRLKGSTRKIENPYDAEERHLIENKNIVFSNEETSTALIRWSDVVVNFASSIGLEAVMQNKVILNPTYLHSNSTIFDDSNVAINCDNPDLVQEYILRIKSNQILTADKKDQKAFYEKFIQGDTTDSDVLGKYVNLVKGGI